MVVGKVSQTQTGNSSGWSRHHVYTLRRLDTGDLESEGAPLTRCCGCVRAIGEGNAFRQGWGLLLIVMLLYVGTVLPARVCFVEMRIESGSYQPNIVSTVIDYIIDCLFAVDLVLNFFFTYRDRNNEEVFDLRRIGLHYLRGFFVLDLIACIPQPVVLALNLVWGATAKSFLKVFRMQRLFRLARLALLFRIKRHTETTMQSGLAKWIAQWHSIRLSNFILSLLWCVHLLACGWYMVATLHKNPQHTWVARRQVGENGELSLLDAGPVEQWIHAVYFMLAIVTTVGFGDISAFTTGEVCYACFAMFVGTMVHSILVSEMMGVISKASAKQSEMGNRLDLINQFAQQTGLGDLVSLKMKECIEAHAKRQTVTSSHYDRQGLRLLLNDGTFPEAELDILAAQVFGGRLRRNVFLTVCCLRSEQLPSRLVLATAISLTHRHCHTGDAVYRVYDYPTSIFLIDSGVFAIVKAEHHVEQKVPEATGAINTMLRQSRPFSTAPAQGTVAGSTDTEQSKKRPRLFPVRVYCRGSVFGHAEVTSRRPRLCTVRCESDGLLLVLDREYVDQLSTEFPQYRSVWRAEAVRTEILIRDVMANSRVGSTYKQLAAGHMQRWARRRWPHFRRAADGAGALEVSPTSPSAERSRLRRTNSTASGKLSLANVSSNLLQDFPEASGASTGLRTLKAEILSEVRGTMVQLFQEYMTPPAARAAAAPSPVTDGVPPRLPGTVEASNRPLSSALL